MDLDSNTLTAEVVREIIHPGDCFYLHRHQGDHGEDDCWCCPLPLTYERVSAMSLGDLQQLLNEFFAVH